jgi:hypothetical protein
MRLRPIARTAPARPADRDAAFTSDSRLRAIVLHMISSNSLAAFTQEISRRPGMVEPVRGATSTPSAGAMGPVGAAPDPQRTLEAVPPQPVRPVPRGSLLDLRV